MTETEQELMNYLKSIWLRMRLGIAIMAGSILLLWLLCWLLRLLRN